MNLLFYGVLVMGSILLLSSCSDGNQTSTKQASTPSQQKQIDNSLKEAIQQKPIIEEIEIKGIKLGMTKSEYAEVYKKNGGLKMTIGGAKNKYSSVDPNSDFVDGKLDRFSFFFASNNYDGLISAIKDKYIDIKCEQSDIQTTAGVTYAQEICQMDDKLGKLIIAKYLSDIETSSLSLSSHASIEKSMQEEEKKKKDI